MGQAEKLIQHVYALTKLKQVRYWENTQLSSNLPRDAAAGKTRHALPRMASWKSQYRSTDTCLSQQQATRQRDLQKQLSYRGPVWLGVHSQAGWKDYVLRQ